MLLDRLKLSTRDFLNSYIFCQVGKPFSNMSEQEELRVFCFLMDRSLVLACSGSSNRICAFPAKLLILALVSFNTRAPRISLKMESAKKWLTKPPLLEDVLKTH